MSRKGKGYFTFVQNRDVDYLKLAYLQALSIKATQEKINNISIAVDAHTYQAVEKKHERIFDNIIMLLDESPLHDGNTFVNEWKADCMTPYDETVKLDCDILFTRNLDHWWPLMQEHDVLCTWNIRDYEGRSADDSYYRKLHKENNLPNLYSGFTYFKHSKTAYEFYEAVQYVFSNWEYYRDDVLKNCRHEQPHTDEVYAIAAVLIGEERCYNPAMKLPTFTHMKPRINNWADGTNWQDHLYSQVDDSANLTVGFNRQLYPFHYVEKDFATDELIEKYERILESR